MINRPSIARRGLIIVVLILACEMAFVGVIANSIIKTRAALAAEQHNLAVVETTSRIANRLQRLATYLTISASDLEKATHVDISQDQLRDDLNQDFIKMAKLTAHDPEARELLIEQQKFLAKMDNVYKRDMLYGNNRILNVVGFSKASLTFRQNVLSRYDVLLSQYKTDRTEKENDSAREIDHLKNLLLRAALINLGAGLCLAFWFSNGLLYRIQNLSRKIENAGKTISAEGLSGPGEGRGDELDQIESSFKQMLVDIAAAKANEELLVKGASDVICTIDREGRILDINSACLTHWGRNRAELLDKNNPRSLRSLLTSKSAGSIAIDTTADGAMSTMDLELVCQNGSPVDTRWTCYWSAEEDSAFCFVQDVRETNRKEALLRQAEEQFSALIKNLPVGILVLDSESRIKSYNSKFEELVGSEFAPNATKARSPIDLDRLIYVDALDRQGLLERATKEPNIRAYIKNANRERIAVELTVEKLNDNDDRLLIIEDVRERARLEKVKSDFVALLQDNLRSPLVQLRAEIKDLDSQQKSDERTTVKLKRIISNSERLIQLIDGLIKVETMRPDKVVGELKPVGIGEVLEAATTAIGDYALAQHITLENVCLPEEKQEIVMADKERLTQVVINLLSNAVKFSPSKQKVTLAVAVGLDYVEVSIIDRGRGMQEQAAAAIFEPYVQAQQKDKYQGTGLGLAICKTIVGAHGGTIGVVSREGEGSRFWFRLPRTLSKRTGA